MIYNPSIYWGQYGQNPGGTLAMNDAFANLRIIDYTYQQMRRENRPVIINGGGFPGALTVPYYDAMGEEGHIGVCGYSLSGCLLSRLTQNRVNAGPKPISFSCGKPLHTATEMNIALIYDNYPGMGAPGDLTKADYEAARSTYQQYIPIFNALDAGVWHPLTGATSTDTSMLLERYGPDASGAIYFVLWTQNGGTGTLTCSNADLGWQSNPNVTVISLLGTAPSTSYSSGQLVLSFGTMAAGETRASRRSSTTAPS